MNSIVIHIALLKVFKLIYMDIFQLCEIEVFRLFFFSQVLSVLFMRSI